MQVGAAAVNRAARQEGSWRASPGGPSMARQLPAVACRLQSMWVLPHGGCYCVLSGRPVSGCCREARAGRRVRRDSDSASNSLESHFLLTSDLSWLAWCCSPHPRRYCYPASLAGRGPAPCRTPAARVPGETPAAAGGGDGVRASICLLNINARSAWPGGGGGRPSQPRMAGAAIVDDSGRNGLLSHPYVFDRCL